MPCRCASPGIFAQSSPDIHIRRASGKKLIRQIALRKNAAELPHPPSVVWLERLCLSADHKRAQLRRALSPRIYPVPHTVSTAACGCSLTGTLTAHRFRNKDLNRFLAALFTSIPHGITTAGLPETNLSRFDLHHAHLFASEYGLGFLFHTKEYIGPGDIDIGNLGNCQEGTPLKFSQKAMAWRNIVW